MTPQTAHVKLFGSLHALRRERDLPTRIDVPIPPGGTSARRIAETLELPVDRIEGVFVNHTVYPLGHLVLPGDEIAFVPHGTPGPHRLYLGLYSAGKDTTHKESGS